MKMVDLPDSIIVINDTPNLDCLDSNQLLRPQGSNMVMDKRNKEHVM